LEYTCLQIELTDPIYGDILESELAEIGFDSFELEPSALKAYIPSDHLKTDELNSVLEVYVDAIDSHIERIIPHENWNANWESNYDPVRIGNHLHIRAPFHPLPSDFPHVITLEPNMSFGTGHHPTTAMMIEALIDLDLDGKTVADFGCGSGVLSIYAAQRGASGIGIEVDPQASDAARSNLKMNEIQSFDIITGNQEQLKGHTFDLILSNINRNVIEESIHIFQHILKPGGWLLCAGFLNEDVEGLKAVLQKHRFKAISERDQNGWTQITSQHL